MGKRCVLIVLDSVGIGELPDAPSFGDAGSDTLGHICEHRQLALPNLAGLGLGNIRTFAGIAPVEAPRGAYGRMTEVSPGKDTTTGHWELMGIQSKEPFRTFPDGFPDEVIAEFCARAGFDRVLANKPTSGTEVIKEFGQEHERTGLPIVYTSADPVFQIAAHEDVISIERLYEICEIAFAITVPLGMSRVIARPFVGSFPDYERTYRRRDFAVPPREESVLDRITAQSLPVIGVGKISQIYAAHGITEERKSKDNNDGIDQTLRALEGLESGVVFTNLVDFDMKYGHRRNTEGYATALEAFDARLPEIVAALGPDDLLLLTADHGNDPTYRGTDHTREYVPIIAFGHGLAGGVALGTRSSFSDVGATVAEFLNVAWDGPGESFWSALGAKA